MYIKEYNSINNGYNVENTVENIIKGNKLIIEDQMYLSESYIKQLIYMVNKIEGENLFLKCNNNYQKYMTNIKSKKVNLTSSNLTEEKLLELKQILPEVFAENKIDWDKLKTVLGNYADRTRKHSYPMAGFMRCGDCGSMLCGQMQKGHLYYSCSHRKDPKCDNGTG